MSNSLWKKARFDEKEVWVEVDENGLRRVNGRVPMRYSLAAAAKIYHAGESKIRLLEDALTQEVMTSVTPETPMLKDEIILYTDGSSKGNPGPAGMGVYGWLPEGEKVAASRSLGVATNNQAELGAIGFGLEVLESKGISRDTKIKIYTDSKYAHGVLSLNWKAKANQELIKSLRQQLSQWPGVRLAWVEGHAGVLGNEEADRLANQGAAGVSDVLWIFS